MARLLMGAGNDYELVALAEGWQIMATTIITVFVCIALLPAAIILSICGVVVVVAVGAELLSKVVK